MQTKAGTPAANTGKGQNPGRMIGFRGRILVLVIGLLSISQLAVMLAVLGTTSSNVIQRAQDELAVGARVFAELLYNREEQLLTSARVLTSDFGFKQAVATRDLATIESALVNHGSRIGADTVVLVSSAGEITAATREFDTAQGFPFSALLARAEAQGQTSGQAILGGRPYQLVMVPVNAPVRIAWAVMGFELDDRLAEDLKKLTGLEVSFGAHMDGNGPHTDHLASTLPAADRAALQARMDDGDAFGSSGNAVELPGGAYFTVRSVLHEQPGQRVAALLQTSRAQAMAPFYQVRNQLVLIAGVTLLLSIIGGVFMARGVTKPIGNLMHAARRIAGGVYDRPVPRESDDEVGMLADTFNQMQQDIAQREEHILHQAHHDVLTNLPNRSNVQKQLQHMLSAAQQTPFTLVLFDIARFKQINDTLGHATGDRVLQTLAMRIERAVRPSGFAARVGGNEFLAVLIGEDHKGELHNIRTLLASVSYPVHLDDANIPIKFNAGVARFPDNGADPETLLRRADIALYAARDRGVEQPLLYREGDDERHLHQLKLLQDLRGAIEGDELELAYQPKISIASHGLVGVEALVRWNHPELGRIPPDSFIPLAEQSGLIQPLTQWVLNSALKACRRWLDMGLDIPVAVNLSGLDVLNPGLPEIVNACLEQTGIEPHMLMLEVTESMLMRDAGLASRQLEELRALGVLISIDDFGTGYSSLAQLRHLPVDQLKIDRSFVMSMQRGSEDATIVRTIIELAHSFKLEVVAEGVENDMILELLAELGCETAQGYGIARPMAADALQQWAGQWREKGKKAAAIAVKQSH